MLDSLTLTHSDILEINSSNLPRVNVIVTFISKNDSVNIDSDFSDSDDDAY